MDRLDQLDGNTLAKIAWSYATVCDGATVYRLYGILPVRVQLVSCIHLMWDKGANQPFTGEAG